MEMPIRRILNGALLAGAVCVASPGAASGLTNGRSYEKVSPAFKAGYGVNQVLGVGPDGSDVVFSSLGVFAGAPGGPSLEFGGYLAHRASSGWAITPEVLPASITASPPVGDLSPEVDQAMILALPGPNDAAVSEGGGALENIFMTHETSTTDVPASWLTDGVVLKNLEGRKMQVEYMAATPDFCHIYFASALPLVAKAGGAQFPIYTMTSGACGSEAALSLLSVNNAENTLSPNCKPALGGFPATGAYNAVSRAGQEIFFNTCIEEGARPTQVFVRLGEKRTLEVSRPLERNKPFGGCGTTGEVPCPGAGARASSEFEGANETGTRVYFETAQSLVPEDTNDGPDLYVAHIGCPGNDPSCQVGEREVTSLELVSRVPGGGEAGDTQGMVRVARDGLRAYFVARGVLSEAPNHEGARAQPGADNLYVYDDEAHTVAFIADLCSGPIASGVVTDNQCPSSLDGAGRRDTTLWTNSTGAEAQTADASGRFLVFSSYGRLSDEDSDAARDVYRFDAETGELARVSVGEEGGDANGNGALDAGIAQGHLGGDAAEQGETGSRAISEDGSRIVFTTAEKLSTKATNGLMNVYEWHADPVTGHEGVTIVSGGDALKDDESPVMSADGRNIFFITVQRLVDEDTDEAADLYDARLSGGFPEAAVAPEMCLGEACKGPLTPIVPMPVPASVLQQAGENVTPPASPSGPHQSLVNRATKHKKKPRRRLVRARRSANQAGTDRRAR